MDDLPFNVVDIAVVVVLLSSAALAYVRGFVREVLSVGAWIGAIFAALYAFPHARPFARQYIEHELGADVAAGAAVFLVSLVLLSVVTHVIARRVQESTLGALDRSLGFLFGVLRGVFLVCLTYLMLEWMVPPKEQPQWLREARTMPLIESGTRVLWALVPEDTAAGVKTRSREIMEQESGRVLGDVLSPRPKGDATDDPDGYGQKERRELNRLFESNKQ